MDSIYTNRYKSLVTIAVVGPFLGFLLAIYLTWNRYVFASDLILLFSMSLITSIGVTIGYHRMLTHRGFECSPWLRGIFLILGCMALLASKPENWAGTHVKHHAHSDEEGDPHSPLKGFFYAHIGWMYNDSATGDPAVYAPDLLKDPVVMFVSKNMWLWAVLSFGIPFALGGWTGLLWGGVVRFFIGTHVMWSVNSICHTFGRRDFETSDESRNNWLIGLLAFGEGWHNNHHAFPRNAIHGMQWWQFDFSSTVISILEYAGLVWNVQRVTTEAANAHRIRCRQTMKLAQELRLQLLDRAAALDAHLRSVIEKKILALVGADEAMMHQSLRRLEVIRQDLHQSARMKRVRLQRYVAELQALTALSAKHFALRLIPNSALAGRVSPEPNPAGF